MPVPTPLPLSVVIISLNEAKRIGDCLDSVRALADDIVVVDAHSRDGTGDLCRTRGARVFLRPWCGYSAQKNFGLAQARHDWILSLDADERVSDELAAALRREFAGEPHSDAYRIRFTNYFGDQRIRFGAWNPEWHVRLFDRRKLQWNADDVHEGLQASDPVHVGRLEGRMHHLTVASHAQLAEKTARYSSLFAARALRQAGAASFSKVWLNPGWRLWRDYVLRLGFLDGVAGALIAWEAARYTHLKYAKASPHGSSFRLLDGFALVGGFALLALVARQSPATSREDLLPAAAAYNTEARIVALAFADLEDDEMTLGTLGLDDDDDVIV